MQPHGYIMLDKEHLVCMLEKSLWLEKTLRQCYLKFDRFMVSSGYTRLQTDCYCYLKHFENSYIILLLYVDDMLVPGSTMKDNVNLKAQSVREFSMKDLDPLKKMLGMRISRKRERRLLKLS